MMRPGKAKRGGPRRRPVRLAAALLATLLAAGGAAAQSCDNHQPEWLMLSLDDLGLGAVEIFYLSDFDPSEQGSHPVLFRFAMENTGAEDLELILSFEVLAPEGMLARGESAPILLAPGELGSGTNLELTSPGSELRLLSYDLSAAGDELEQEVLATGTLPEGEYEFRIALAEAGEELSVCSLRSYVSNPRIVVPLYPGGPFGESLPLESTALPLFQWESGASRFDLRLCPVLSGDLSGEEVMANEPVYEHIDLVTGFSDLHSYLYPASAERLESGGSYCWQVQARVTTSGGEVLYPGEILCFEIAGEASLAPHDDLLRSLLLLLPPGQLDEALVRLQGYHATGRSSVDGLLIENSELPLFIHELLSQGWEVGGVEVEP